VSFDSEGWLLWPTTVNASLPVSAFRRTGRGPAEARDHVRILLARARFSERAIVDGLRSGRVYIRTKGVDGPQLDVTLHANVTGAAGQRITWMRNGKPLAEAAVPPNGSATLDVDDHPGDAKTP
jgi:hypothetical protein